jgi:hypothetical protein
MVIIAGTGASMSERRLPMRNPSIVTLQLTSNCTAYRCMKDFFTAVDIISIEETLTDCLKGDMGNDKDSGKHNPMITGHQVGTVELILRFLRMLPVELSGIYIKDDKALKEIQDAFSAFDYENFDVIIFSGLKSWIYQDEDVDNSCISYALKISKAYSNVLDIIKKCWSYYKAVNVHEQGAANE